MKKFFITGFLTLLPLALTVMITVWCVDLLTEPLLGVAKSLVQVGELAWGIPLSQYPHLTPLISRLLALLLLIVGVFLLGLLTRHFFFSLCLKGMDKIFSRIPFIRTIYRVTLDVTRSFSSDNAKTFKKTVLIPFPHHQALAMGFMTGEAPPQFKALTNSDWVVFVPTSPHPISGFVLLTPQNLTLPIDVSVEEAFKFILSCGTIVPVPKEL